MKKLIDQSIILLKEIKSLQKHQREIQKLKGESFNIFSILQVETKENKTHSNFIAELLNPKGSHFMGTEFLRLFLEEIEYKGQLDLNSASVVKEFFISNKKDVEGGRIDILLKDRKGNYISIENKIHAGDQENQLIRYSNYKKGQNTLYYLTLGGNEASEHSTVYSDGESNISLEAGKDYHCLSYSNHILNWLNTCMHTAINQPQVRDSIKQYILLIKKLTNQMLDPKTKELQQKLFEYHEAAQYISDNFQRVKNEIKEKFRIDLVARLQEKLDKSRFEFHYPHSVSSKGIAQIFVQLKELPESHFQFLIESFSGFGHFNGELFVGIYDHSGKQGNFPLDGSSDELNTKHWKSIHRLKYNNKPICLNDNTLLSQLIDSENIIYRETIELISSQCATYINEKYQSVYDFFNQIR